MCHGSVFRLDDTRLLDEHVTHGAWTWEMRSLQEVSYQVRLVSGVLDPANDLLAGAGAWPGEKAARRVVVADSAVNDVYGEAIHRYFGQHSAEHRLVVLDVCEERKRLELVTQVIDELDRFGIDRRREPLVAIGGGVLMDVAAFAASIYRRSTPYVRVPTTLVGLVDAGVGAKTGVNYGRHKNRVGTYFPSTVTLCDRGFLATLDRRHVVNGMAEILKIALIKDRRLFELLEVNGSALIASRFQDDDGVRERVAVEVLHRAIEAMLEELAPNLWEQKLERVVDYGHSFSPTLEMHALPELLHGEAVAVDMALTTVLSVQRGLVSSAEATRVFGVMRALGLPLWHPLCESNLLREALHDTIRHRNGQQRVPLARGIGAATFVNDLCDTELARAAEVLAREACRG
jgi:3-dehydroquinate synthase